MKESEDAPPTHPQVMQMSQCCTRRGKDDGNEERIDGSTDGLAEEDDTTPPYTKPGASVSEVERAIAQASRAVLLMRGGGEEEADSPAEGADTAQDPIIPELPSAWEDDD